MHIEHSVKNSDMEVSKSKSIGKSFMIIIVASGSLYLWSNYNNVIACSNDLHHYAFHFHMVWSYVYFILFYWAHL